MHKPLTWLQVMILAAFLFLHPIVVGSVYIGFLTIRLSMPQLIDTRLHYLLLGSVAIIMTLVTQLIFPVFPSLLMTIAFAGVLTWIFGKRGKQLVKTVNRDQRTFKTHYSASDEIIDAEIISETTHYK